jgi:hypothetical protein
MGAGRRLALSPSSLASATGCGIVHTWSFRPSPAASCNLKSTAELTFVAWWCMCAARRERRWKWRNIVLTAGFGCVGLDWIPPYPISHLLHFLLPDLFVGPSPFPAREQLLLPRKNPLKKPPKKHRSWVRKDPEKLPSGSLIYHSFRERIDTVSLRLLGFPIVQATNWTFSDTR